MRIREIEIANFLSIRRLRMQCERQVVLLGPNNHGKSNILRAIDFFLSSGKAEPSLFFHHRDNDELWVEAVFDELTAQEQNTFKKYVRADGSIKVRKTAKLDGNKVESTYNGYVQKAEEWWLDDSDETILRLSKREEISKTPLADKVPGSGKITKDQVREAQAKHISENKEKLRFTEKLEAGNFLGRVNIAQGVLPEFYLVPAVRDLTDEVKIKAGTALGRLLNRAVQEMAASDPRYAKIKEELEDLINGLKKGASAKEKSATSIGRLEKDLEQELSAWGVGVDILIHPPPLEKIFELGTELLINDGITTAAERKGHGLQRAIMFAMVRAWARALRVAEESGTSVAPRRASESVIFAMEEPELFLHPHAQRQLAKALHEIAETPEHQAFVSTHSTHFVDLDRYREIIIVSKSDSKQGTQVRQCMTDLFEGEDDRKHKFHMARWVNPDRAEMFFARRVVFVEGETEQAVFPFIGEKLVIFDPDVSIIDCGSKFNLRLYAEIANAFHIDYLVVHDEDPLPDPIPVDWSEEKRASKRRAFSENDRIKDAVNPDYGERYMFQPDFEGAAGISKSQVDKKSKAIAALDHFQKIDANKIDERIKTAVQLVYKKRTG